MPPKMDYPTISAVFSADWNIFGFDPNGLLAYLVAYFFGPQFRPATLGHLPRWVGEVLPPRYGPPGPQQAARLPLGWKPNPPPLYYGVPSGPYLPSPKTFSPSGFASMLRPHPRAPIGFVSEAKSEDTGEIRKRSMTLWKTYLGTAFNVTIRFACGAGARLGYFIVPSDIEWWIFRSKICKRLGANSATARLAYRQFHDVLYGSLCLLRGAGDWDGAMDKMREADAENANVELEIVDVVATKVRHCGAFIPVSPLILAWQTTSRGRKRPQVGTQAAGHLSDRGIPIETFYFQYPHIEDLLKLLDNEADGYVAGWSLNGLNLREMLRRARMERMDDFVLTSPRTLHVTCGIPAKAVNLLYLGATKMIKLVHMEMETEIREIRELREEYARGQERDASSRSSVEA
jgi:hypothetical protein